MLADTVREGDYGYVLLPATAMGRDLGPRAVSMVDGVMFSDCVEVGFEDGAVMARRPVYSGKLYVEIAPTGERPTDVNTRTSQPTRCR